MHTARSIRITQLREALRKWLPGEAQHVSPALAKMEVPYTSLLRQSYHFPRLL